MKNEYNNSTLPPVTFYETDIVHDKDGLKLSWHDPEKGLQFYDEENLVMLELAARDMLVNRYISVEPEWTTEIHAKWRDLHYNAEHGLKKLQNAKLARGIMLKTDYRPVI